MLKRRDIAEAIFKMMGREMPDKPALYRAQQPG